MAPKPTREPDQQNASNALLLVEEDDGVRRFLFWALYLEGFKVLTARDAEEALRLSRDIAAPIEVLIIGSLPSTSDAAELRKLIEVEHPGVRSLLLRDVESLDVRGHAGSKLTQSRVGESINAEVLIRTVRSLVAQS